MTAGRVVSRRGSTDWTRARATATCGPRRTLSRLRLAAFLGGVAALWWSLASLRGSAQTSGLLAGLAALVGFGVLVVRHARVLDAIAHADAALRARRARDWRGSRATGTRFPTFRAARISIWNVASLRARSRSLRPRVGDEMARRHRDARRRAPAAGLAARARARRRPSRSDSARSTSSRRSGSGASRSRSRAPRSGDAPDDLARVPRVGRRRYVGGSRDAAAARDRTDAGDVGIAGGLACGCCHETSADDRRHVPVVACRCLEQRLVVDPRRGERDSVVRACGPRLRGVRSRDARRSARCERYAVDADRSSATETWHAPHLARAAGAPARRRQRARSPSQAGPARRMVGAPHRRGAAALSHPGPDVVGLSRPLRAASAGARGRRAHVRGWLEALGRVRRARRRCRSSAPTSRRGPSRSSTRRSASSRRRRSAIR